LRKGSDGKFEQKALAKDTKSESAVKVNLDDNDSDDLPEGSTNLYYTDARVNTVLATKDSDDTKEGSTNLYYTDARANSAIDAKLTGDITLGNVSSASVRSISFEQFTDYNVISDSSDIASDLGSITSGAGASIDQGLILADGGLPLLPSYDVANLPSGHPAGTFVFCPDEAGGPTIVFYDGTNWRRPSDSGLAS